MYVVLIVNESGQVRLGASELFETLELAQQEAQGAFVSQSLGEEERAFVYMLVKAWSRP